MYAYLTATYFVVALVFAIATYLEGRERGGDWTLWRATGLALSLAWPILMVVVGAAIWWNQKKGKKCLFEPTHHHSRSIPKHQ